MPESTKHTQECGRDERLPAYAIRMQSWAFISSKYEKMFGKVPHIVVSRVLTGERTHGPVLADGPK